MLTGFQYPETALGIKQLMKPLIFVAMLLMGIRQNFSEMVSAIKNYNAIVFSMFTSYLVSPLMGYLLSKFFFGSQGMIFVGVMIASTVCTTLVSAVVWTAISEGNESLAIVLSIFSSFACVFFTPCILYLFLNQTIEISVVKMIKDLILIMIPPIIIAQIIRYYWKFDFKRFSSFSKILGQIIILSTILLATTSFRGISFSGIFLVLFMAFIHFSSIALFSYHFSAFFTSKKNAIAIMYCSSLKSVPAAALISMTYFEPMASVYILFYHIVQQVMAQITAKKCRH